MSVRDAFRDQAGHCAGLGSPFMARLMSLAAERLQPGSPVTDRIFGWTGDPSANADNVPLRLAGALHSLRLQGLALSEVYPPRRAGDDTLWSAVEDAIDTHADVIVNWLDNPPQTNEVRRAAAILPALAVLQHDFGLPVELIELGTSGGLNLRSDRFHLKLPGGSIGPSASDVILTPDWSGRMPPTTLPEITTRFGVDMAPLNPSDPDDELKLLSYLWADQPERIARTRAAIKLAQSVPAEISAGDAGEWLERHLSKPDRGRLRVVFHTLAWQYFSQATRDRAETAMRSADGPLARIAMENNGGQGAAVTLTTWPNGNHREIARADFHGRWIDWLL